MATHIQNLWPLRKKQCFKPHSCIVITGAASGIGRAVALAYAARDSRLVLGDMNEQELQNTVAACKKRGVPCVGVKLNVTKDEECKKLIDTAVEQFGEIDQLVLCAGIAAHHTFANTKDFSVFNKLMDVNFYGYLYCTRHAFTHLCKSGGVLVAVTSFSGEVGLPYRTAYCASKFAVTGFLEALRSEMEMMHKEKGQPKFDISIVCPPTIDSNLRANSLTVDPSLKGATSETAMTVDECAAAILDAADRRLRKAFFPFKSWAASYVRPFLPDLIDRSIRKRAAL